MPVKRFFGKNKRGKVTTIADKSFKGKVKPQDTAIDIPKDQVGAPAPKVIVSDLKNDSGT